MFGNSQQENGRPAASQMKLKVPAALVELFSERSNVSFKATSCSRLVVSRRSVGVAFPGCTATQRRGYNRARQIQIDPARYYEYKASYAGR